MRLKEKTLITTIGEYNKFLFQTGAIKSILRERVLGILRSFYSKLVRLKVYRTYYRAGNVFSFYSKLVRLKVLKMDKIEVIEGAFLFQTGAIKSSVWTRHAQSIKEVSIPNWCD